MKLHSSALTRRTLLKSATAFAGGLLFPAIGLGKAHDPPAREFRIKPTSGTARLTPKSDNETPVWGYNGIIPGTEIRVRQGERIRITAVNDLDEETTVHWHGVRTPHAMDGVPHLTQRPIAPGETFVYEFGAIDAGTFWYLPHQRSFEQVGRGLYGALIIEEANPVRVDREVTWILDDWRLTRSAVISDNFGNRHDMMHNGRIGNTVTINGAAPEDFIVRRGDWMFHCHILEHQAAGMMGVVRVNEK